VQRGVLAVSIGMVMGAMGSPAAWADDGPAASATSLDKVVVTATRTQDTLADAPVAATVLTETFIRDARIDSLRDIDDYVPNVHFNQIGQVGGTYITIRGIESNPFIANRAAVYIDGIPFRQPADQALGFAEQVEVLRGPQGTLYGANTESGLVLIQTRAPGDVLEAEAVLDAQRFGHGTGLDGRVRVSGPLTSTLGGSLVLARGQTDSYVGNPVSSIGEAGEIRDVFSQGKLRWQPGEHTRVDLLAYVSSQRAPGLYEQEFLPMDRAVYDANYADAFNGGRRIGRSELLHDAPKRTEEDEVALGASLRHAFASSVLDVALSWRDVEERSFGTDLDMTATPMSAGGHADDERYLNLEARWSSGDDATVRWVVGYNHYRDEREKRLSTLVGPGGLDDYRYAPAQSADARDHAVFAQLTVPVAERVRVGAGVRYERAERTKAQQAGALDLGALGVFAFPEEQLRATYDDVLPRLWVDWKPSDHWLLYASVAKGWIPGGFNLAAASASVDRDYSRYDAESLWTYEVGAKAVWLDGRVMLGVALFQTEADQWQDYSILYNAQGQVVSTTLITTDASIRTRGVEVELSARPAEGWDITASLGLVDAEYTDYTYGLVNLRGGPVKLVPDWDASLAVGWRPWRGLLLRGELQGVGDMALHAQNIARQPAYWTGNLQIGWESTSWSLRLYVDNITDRRAFVTSAYTNSLFGYDGTWYAGINAPRTVGVVADWRW
jgi:iron complex outermembrane recepter protein